MADITGELEKITHVTTINEAEVLLKQHDCKTYKQTSHTGRILAAYKISDDNSIVDVTEQEQTAQEIEEYKKLIKHLQAIAKKE